MLPPSIAPPATKLRTIRLKYDPTPAKSDASGRALIFSLFPEWETSEGAVEFVRFKDGITNTLLKAIKRRPGYSDHQIDQEAVLLRAYGNGTEMLIDREREASSHALLAQHDLAPSLLARFDNGLLYRFIAGSPCTPADLRKPEIARAVASRLGEWHAILSASDGLAAAPSAGDRWDKITAMIPGKPVPNLWTVLRKWIAALPSDTDELRQRNALLLAELETATKKFGNAEGLQHGEYVLAHCDLLSGNVIVQPGRSADHADAEREVSFIDYEYTTPAPASFDLANHFAEWGGFDCDYSVLPTVSQRQDFLRSYVSSYRAHANRHRRREGHETTSADNTTASSPASSTASAVSDEEDSDVSRLMAEVDAFRGIPGLYWGVWALIQATISQIDFDYASYAEVRLQEYWDWKAELDGSRKASGRETPLRESRLGSP